MYIEKKPLGYIQLLNNIQKPVYPMDDLFINYIFYKKENWGHLRDMLNIILEAYAAKYNRQDGFHLVDRDIVVKTQYEHYLKNTTKQPTQDVKIDEMKHDDQTYVEFQNKTFSKPPIAIRASNYSGLAVNKAKDGSKVSQIWLLAENDDNVLCGQAISNFRMREDNTDDYYPREVNTMFVSLPRLMEEKSICGELSRLLMGMEIGSSNGSLKDIADMFKYEYETFKQNEEVIQSMTVLEERFEEGLAIGEEKGRTEGIIIGKEEGRTEGIIIGKEEGRTEGIAIGEARADVKAEAIYNKRIENVIIEKIRNNESPAFLKVIAVSLGISRERFDELVENNKVKQKGAHSLSNDER